MSDFKMTPTVFLYRNKKRRVFSINFSRAKRKKISLIKEKLFTKIRLEINSKNF